MCMRVNVYTQYDYVTKQCYTRMAALPVTATSG